MTLRSERLLENQVAQSLCPPIFMANQQLLALNILLWPVVLALAELQTVRGVAALVDTELQH
jgi:hypothetical protein